MAEFIRWMNTIVWGPGMLLLFLMVGIWFSIRTRFFQITHLGLWVKHTLLACFRDKKTRKTHDKNSISQFQSLCTALAGTIGVGNIAGVAFAITAGGPGAIFWMWVSALFGMMTSFAEIVLGIRYRQKDGSGKWTGGAMVYIEKGLQCKWLAVLFSVFCVLASFGMGNMAQSNQIAEGLQHSIGIPKWTTGLVLTALAGLIILGGIKRIAAVTEKLVPFMAMAYLLGGCMVLLVHANQVPRCLQMIVSYAFRLDATASGVAGYTLSLALSRGMARGVFSNEAGLGSSVMAHILADVKHPVEQGMWGIFQVFIDTFIVCTMTALVILCSGVYSPYVYGVYAGSLLPSKLVDGVRLTAKAFSTVFGIYGNVFICCMLVLFAFSTLVGWSCYGEMASCYLFGKKAAKSYKIVYIIIIFVGCVTQVSLITDLSELFNGLMAVPNLIALMLLSGEVVEVTKNYMTHKRRE